MNKNLNTYIKKYSEGYGLMYPDGHIIRINEWILKYRLGLVEVSGKTLFDFGCGNGIHLAYFAKQGYVPYGVDIVPTAIKHCQNRLPQYKDNFILIEPNQVLRSNFPEYYPKQFDFILANQSLYYLSDTLFRDTIAELEKMLAPNGVALLTMIGTQCYYYNNVTRNLEGGLKEVSLSGRLNEVTLINFTPDEDDLINRFCMFDKISTESYSITFDGEEAHHYYFV